MKPEEGNSVEMVGGPLCGGLLAFDGEDYPGRRLLIGSENREQCLYDNPSIMGLDYVSDGNGKAIFDRYVVVPF